MKKILVIAAIAIAVAASYAQKDKPKKGFIVGETYNNHKIINRTKYVLTYRKNQYVYYKVRILNTGNNEYFFTKDGLINSNQSKP